MKISLLFGGFLTASLVLGDKTVVPIISDAFTIKIDQKNIVKEIDGKGAITSSYTHRPYSFTECIGDLEHVFLSLVNDINYSENNDQFVKDKQFLKQKVSKKDNFLTYSLVSFTTQVLKICSPETVNELLPQLLLEFNNPRYPKTCVIGSAKNDKKEKNSCFDVLQRLTPLITSNKIENTFNDIQKVKLTRDFIEDYKTQQFLAKKLDRFSISSNTKNKAGKYKTGKHKFRKDKTEKLFPKTVSKTLFKVIKTQSFSDKYLTVTQLSQVTKPAFKIYKKADTAIKVKGSVTTTTVTDLLINLSVSTILLEPKTLTATYNGNLSKGRAIINAEVTPQVFNFLSRLSALPHTVNSNTTTTNQKPFKSRLCDRITMFGLQCPFRTTTTIPTAGKSSTVGNTSTVAKTTEYVNININVNENKGYIKLLRQSVFQKPKTVTKVVTQKTTIETIIASTKFKQVKTLTTMTDTLFTTKTKYKIVTQTQTKNIHDCDSKIHEHEVDDNGLTEDDYFEDDSRDYFKESNEFLESSADYKTNKNSESDEGGEILVIQQAANNINYSVPSYLMKTKNSKLFESPNFNNSNSSLYFADKLEIDNGAKIKLVKISYSEMFGLITLFLISSIL